MTEYKILMLIDIRDSPNEGPPGKIMPNIEATSGKDAIKKAKNKLQDKYDTLWDAFFAELGEPGFAPVIDTGKPKIIAVPKNNFHVEIIEGELR